MAGRIRRLAVLATLGGILLIALVLLTISYVEVGITDDFWVESFVLTTQDFSDVPQSVVDDATALAKDLFGDSQEKYQRFVDQLLGTYTQARDKDFIVVFNSGGWGWNLPEKSPGWESILKGISGELDELGYSSLVLNYRRTGETTWGCVRELVEVVNNYPAKAKDLACRMEFLTGHIPDLRVIVTGESNGTVIADSVMDTLEDNQQIYCIQTGTPFWHSVTGHQRKLVLNSNGTGPDAFAQGDIPAMLWVSLKSSLGFAPERAGTIFLHLKAPGHDYSWHYPEVYTRIATFITGNFGAKQR